MSCWKQKKGFVFKLRKKINLRALREKYFSHLLLGLLKQNDHV